jgi:hypothetical protein
MEFWQSSISIPFLVVILQNKMLEIGCSSLQSDGSEQIRTDIQADKNDYRSVFGVALQAHIPEHF